MTKRLNQTFHIHVRIGNQLWDDAEGGHVGHQDVEASLGHQDLEASLAGYQGGEVGLADHQGGEGGLEQVQPAQ